MQEREEVLLVHRLCSGDRPSVFTAGLLVSEALKKTKTVVISYDALGRVILLPPEAIRVTSPPRIKNEDLDTLEEEQALAIMVDESRTDAEMMEYLKHRQGVSDGS